MDKHPLLTKLLATIGTVLLWLPIAAMVFFSIAHLIGTGRFLMDYLMPGELFFVVAAGALLLLWAAIRAKSHIKPVVWGMAVGLAGLVISQGLAMLTGLASGEREATGWPLVLVLGIYIIYILAEIFLGVVGIRLARKIP
jgi:hypothetical protein